ncbi:MAG TPA: hypothetical protein VJV75_09010, partial [Candidatus Polarisedimenticolia bacterium]|nr:hypothetical protein [Candidatus Polarisedimenticolia bacterium]
GSYIDTSATHQTKTGPVTFQSGLTANSNVFAVYGVGTGSGGAFANQDLTSIALIGHSGSGLYGLRADATDAGGFFRDSDNFGAATLATGDTGVVASGLRGATLFVQGRTGTADLATYDSGIEARGDIAGGFMINTATGGAYATLADHYGIESTGIYCPGFCGAGAHFGNLPYTGQTWAAIGDTGIYSRGTYGGGEFVNTSQTGHSWFGSGDFGVVGQGRYNSVSRQGGAGYFADLSWGGRSVFGTGGYGVWSSGPSGGGQFVSNLGFIDDEAWAGVSGIGVQGWTDAPHVSGKFYWHDPNTGNTPGEVGVAFTAINDKYTIAGPWPKAFAQNDPTDPARQVIFIALEGDEAGTYTRGTGRIHRGEARLDLDPAFTAVTNPDVGLTAIVTPRGSVVPVAIESLTADALVVRGDRRLAEGTIVDYVVYGLRLGFEAHPAVQAKQSEAPLPPESVTPADPASPLARFAAMRGSVDPGGAPDLSRSVALRAAARRVSAPGGALSWSRPLAEPTGKHQAELPAGTVAAFDAEAGRLVPATGTEGEMVAGIAGVRGVAGATTADSGLALGGSLAFCLADATTGAIRVGDLLAPAALAGHARRAAAGDDGAIVAKALEPLEEGTGTIRVLVMSR